MAGTTKCVLRLLKSRIFSCPLTVPQTEVNLAQMRRQGLCSVGIAPVPAAGPAAGRLFLRLLALVPAAARGPPAPLSAAHFQSRQLPAPPQPGSKVSLLTSHQVSFPAAFTAASRRLWVLMYAFPDICAAEGDTGPLLEHPFPYPPLRGFVPV